MEDAARQDRKALGMEDERSAVTDNHNSDDERYGGGGSEQGDEKDKAGNPPGDQVIKLDNELVNANNQAVITCMAGNYEHCASLLQSVND